MFPRLTILLVLVSPGAFAQSPAPASTVSLPALTPVLIQFDEKVSSEKNRNGDRFRFHVAADVRVGDAVVIPQGAPGEGEVIHAAKSGMAGKAGELIVAAPLKASKEEELPALPGGIDHPLARWPEGYAYTSFCLSVAAAILKELGADEPTPAQVADDPGFWSSFRENTHEDPETAVGFFDLVCGGEPNWAAPGVPWLRKAFAQQGTLPRNKV